MIHVALCGSGVTHVALCGSGGSKFQNMAVVVRAGEALKDTVKNQWSGAHRKPKKKPPHEKYMYACAILQ